MSRSGLVVSRARVERDWALLPPEGMAESVLPEWTSTVAKVMAAPAMGARFVQYDLRVAKGGGTQQKLPEHVQAFVFVQGGSVRCDVNGAGHTLG
ncbi:MAG: (S)-ureidoglycine aminohydrolase, partial [Candidatus Eisenbacteria bacterium]